jgi:hypothetical protein
VIAQVLCWPSFQWLVAFALRRVLISGSWYLMIFASKYEMSLSLKYLFRYYFLSAPSTLKLSYFLLSTKLHHPHPIYKNVPLYLPPFLRHSLTTNSLQPNYISLNRSPLSLLVRPNLPILSMLFYVLFMWKRLFFCRIWKEYLCHNLWSKEHHSRLRHALLFYSRLSPNNRNHLDTVATSIATSHSQLYTINLIVQKRCRGNRL